MVPYGICGIGDWITHCDDSTRLDCAKKMVELVTRWMEVVCIELLWMQASWSAVLMAAKILFSFNGEPFSRNLDPFDSTRRLPDQF